MGDDLSTYEEERLAIERKKLEALQGIKKTLKHQSRMESIHDLMDRMDVDRDDVEALAGKVAGHFGGGRDEDKDEGGDLTSKVAKAIDAATGADVEVDVEVDDEEE